MKKGHTLDLIITRSSDNIILTNPVADYLFSDHFSISCKITLLKPQIANRVVTYRPKKIELPLFLDDLASSDLCLNPPENHEDLLNCYNTTLHKLYDHHAPTKEKTVATRRRVPWLNNSTKQAIQARRKAERKWRSTSNQKHLAVFRRIRNSTTSLMNRQRCEFYSDWINENSQDQRQFFRKARPYSV